MNLWTPKMVLASDLGYAAVLNVMSIVMDKMPKEAKAAVVVDIMERLKGRIEELTGLEAHDKPITDLRRKP